jgi:drug/metabolite transporter (DMT)-like permease
MQNLSGILYVLGAATLFGLSAPLSKLVVRSMSPVMLAAMLYLGAAGALTLYRIARSLLRAPSSEAALRGRDFITLGAMVVLGGVAGPILMLTGLARMPAIGASLMLNLEAPLTIAGAIVFFGESLDWKEAAGAVAIIAGAGVLGGLPGHLGGSATGALLIAGACACWAADNNLSQRLSIRDPIAIVHLKAIGAGSTNLIIAYAIGAASLAHVALSGVLAIGAVCYGVSMVMAVLALRHLGAARWAAYFATAPFIGAVASIPIVGERPNSFQAIAAVAMVAGVAILTRARHDHEHTHETLAHEHIHVHDSHHHHSHQGPVSEPHSHWHRHEPIMHVHPHASDVHHRHRHPS